MTLSQASRSAKLIDQVLGIRVPGQKYPRRVIKEKTKIAKAYREFKTTHDFTTSGELARRIWLTDYLLTL